MRAFVRSLLSFTIMLTFGCAGKKDEKKKLPNDPSTLVAVVAGDSITLQDFKLFALKRKYEKFDLSVPSNRQYVLDDAVKASAIAKWASDEHYGERSEVRKKVETMRDEYLYQRTVRHQVIMPLLQESDLKSYYEKMKIEVRLKQIFVGQGEVDGKFKLSPSGKMKNHAYAQSLSDSIYNAVKARPEIFDAMVEQYSDDVQSKLAGGDLGFLRYDQIEARFQEVIFSLKESEVSKPIEGGNGFHIFKLMERRNSEGLKSFDEMKNGLAEIMLDGFAHSHNKEIRERLASFSDSLLSVYDFRIDKHNCELFLQKYHSIKRPAEIISIFNEGEKKLALATFRNGEIVIEDLIVQIADNKGMVKLDMQKMMESLPHAATTLIFADYARFRKWVLESREEIALKNYEKELMVPLALKTNVDDRVEVSEDRLLSHYNANPSRFKTADEYSIAKIVSTDQDLIGQYAQELKEKNNFEEIYRRAEKNPKAICSEPGFVKDDKSDEFISYASQLSAGQIGGPLQNAKGEYAIIHLLDKRLGSLVRYEKVKPLVESDYRQTQKQVLLANWMDKLTKKYNIQKFEDRLTAAYELKLQ